MNSIILADKRNSPLLSSIPMEKYDAVIIGAGPGGLACAAILAQNGLRTLVVERNCEIGAKVCAGGITWSGLLRSVPDSLIERAFPRQYIQSRLQTIRVTEKQPIIATVSRVKLGRHMARIAQENGAEIQPSTSLQALSQESVKLFSHINKQHRNVGFHYLIGADGSSSLVRRYLGIPMQKVGLGINYQLTARYDEMEWHLNSHYFNNGYSWIFPHQDTLSIGAYLPERSMSPSQFKLNLQRWAKTRGFDLSPHACSAGLISYDYRGHQFGRFFLVGDAAGFASALTGEGIYPAIISGKAVAESILNGEQISDGMKELIKRQRRFVKMVNITSKGSLLAAILAEAGVFALRTGLIDFTVLEMST